MTEEKENVLEKLNNSLVDFVEKTFGESGKQWIEETQEKIKDFSSDAIKKFMEFSDEALEKLNLHENESVIKAKDSVEDFLKQAGLLKDDQEDEF